MSGVRTVYLVTSGTYSDYTTWCAFESKADAEAYMEAVQVGTRDRYYARSYFSVDDLRIEELQLWSVVPVVRVTEPSGYGEPDIEELEPSAESAG